MAALEAENVFLGARNGKLEKKLERMATRQEELERRTRQDSQNSSNATERALRPAVIGRRVRLGTQSERGGRFEERILTVRATLKQQNRDVLDGLTAACIAQLRHEPPAFLLPLERGAKTLRA